MLITHSDPSEKCFHLTRYDQKTSFILYDKQCFASNQWRLVLKKLGGGANKLKVRAIWSKLLDPFLSSSERLVKGIFVKIKPNVLSSGDIALVSTLISTCLSTDELLLSGMRVDENGPITRGQTYKNNIDSL